MPQNGHLEATFDRWKQLYGGLMPSEVKKLRHLERPARPSQSVNISRGWIKFSPIHSANAHDELPLGPNQK